MTSKQSTANSEAAKQIGLVMLLYLGAVAIIGTEARFDLGDSFIYSHAVDAFLRSGQLALGGSIATCYLHLLAGAAASVVFGASHQTLCYLSLLWGLVFILAFWFTVREIGAGPRLSTLCTLALLFNPMILYLCFAFMTDVPYLTLVTLFALFLLKSINRRSILFFLLASIFLDCSIAVRQIGIINVLPALCALPAFKDSKRDLGIAGIAILVLPVVILYGLTHFVPKDHITVLASSIMAWNYAELYRQTTGDPVTWLWHVGGIVGEIACYAGLFSMPILALFICKKYSMKLNLPRLCVVVASVVMTVGLSYWLLKRVLLMPFDGNLMIPPWLGPLSIIGGVQGYVPVWVRLALTAAGAYLGFALIAVLILTLSPNVRNLTIASLGRLKDGVLRPYRPNSLVGWFLGLSLLVNIVFVIFHLAIWDVDRYQLPILPPLLLCLAFAARKLKVQPSLEIAAPLIVLMMLYSVASMQDHMYAQRARYKAIDQLVASGIKPTSIDGGWEYDTTINFSLCDALQPSDPTHCAISARGTATTSKLRQWPINGEEYIISMIPVAGYEIKSKVPFWSLIRLHDRDVLILAKANKIEAAQTKLP